MFDDKDIQRELENTFIHTNILFRKFHKCSFFSVNTMLFKAYFLCMYDIASSTKFKANLLKLHSSYNKRMKLFFGYRVQTS